MKKLRVGLIGLGFIGIAHAEAIRSIGCAELYAVASANASTLRARAEALGVSKAYETAEEMIADPCIDVIHNCTPNHLHLSINKQAIRAGKHIFSEKPLACTAEESAELLECLKEHPDVVAGLNFNYRMNVLVQDMKNRVAAGEIGKPRLIYGSYLQDWLFYDTDYDWRLEKEFAGPSRAVADVGSHWMDTAQTVAGARIVEVCANLRTLIPVRQQPAADGSGARESFPVTTEDYAGVLLQFENGATGLFQISQVSAGRKCYLDLAVDGELASYYWNQEEADRMWIGHRNAHNELVMRNPQLITPAARQYTYMPTGHPAGWNDAQRNNIYAFYRYILDGKRLGEHPADYATFEDGHYIMKLVEAILKSSEQRRWVKVEA